MTVRILPDEIRSKAARLSTYSEGSILSIHLSSIALKVFFSSFLWTGQDGTEWNGPERAKGKKGERGRRGKGEGGSPHPSPPADGWPKVGHW